MHYLSSKALTKSTAYDDYWRFAALRHQRFFSSDDFKKTIADPILNDYKFTNCYRVLDRVSQFLVKNITSNNHYDAPDIFFRTLIFKLFNKIETWQSLESRIGDITLDNFKEDEYICVLSEMKAQQSKIYSAAYIMPSGKKEWGSSIKHENNIRMIRSLINDGMHENIWISSNLEDIYKGFLKIRSIGKFLAFQYAIDIAYSHHSMATEDQFVMAGPGAARGIKKCFPNAVETDFNKIIEYMALNQNEEFSRLGLSFQGIKNRPLQLVDCQNLFCEVDKYLRVKRPELDPRAKRIKQRYTPHGQPIQYCLPSKWNAHI
jgi:hypothetical protein